ncbi:hypothetical protein NP233_g3647 [Leucocoprinus birnbaumii]|uniref:Hydrophobin n=1 Tax=Leucocoprinus birnbaumii TaxID=56174 RepID=A0AAD5YY70_9AGAR|nr:hypothetical protein NP233_g3647 [Leucocoprinus birnbaumii]
MQFTKFFAVAALVSAVAALPGGTLPAGSCSTGTQTCCNTLQSADRQGFENDVASAINKQSGLGGLLSGLLGALTVADVLSNPDVQAGLSCVPVNVLGIGGNKCTQQVACCSGNTFNGLVNVGCSPLSVL